MSLHHLSSNSFQRGLEMAFRFERIWYENDEGEYIPATTEPWQGAPSGATIQVSRFPREVHTKWLRLKDDGGCELIASATSSYSSDLVLAMCRPTLRDRTIQFLRYGSFAKTYDFEMAVLLAAETCERCMNSLAHRHGLSWGYREFSDEWHLAGTTCHRCEHHGRGRFWVCGENGFWATTAEGKLFAQKQYEAFQNRKNRSLH